MTSEAAPPNARAKVLVAEDEALIRLDLFGIGAVLAGDTSGLATFVLFFQTALTFGAVSMGVAVMHLGED